MRLNSVCHFITCLDDGGAEAILYSLVKSTPNIRHSVVSLKNTGGANARKK
jgi:hypothetical protein